MELALQEYRERSQQDLHAYQFIGATVLSTLQSLCEELGYCDLVDNAVLAFTALERKSWAAAFAISVYASTRASHKPFNPLLGGNLQVCKGG